MQSAEFNDGFNAGTIAALGILHAHDDPVAWREIVEAAGTHSVLVHALVEGDDWEWAGFAKYAKEELGQAAVSKARATARRIKRRAARSSEGGGK